MQISRSVGATVRRWIRLLAALVVVLSLAAARAAGEDLPVTSAKPSLPIEIRGEVEVVQEDDFVDHCSRRLYFIRDHDTGKSYELSSPTQELVTGTHVLLQGLLDQATGRVSVRTMTPLPEPSRPLSRAASDLSMGAQRAVVLIAHFLDATPSCSSTQIAGMLWTNANSADALWSASSFGSVFFPEDSDQNGKPDILGPYLIPFRKSDPCTLSDFAEAVDAAVLAAGADLSQYAYRVYIFPTNETCTGGLGTVGPCFSFCRTWIFSCDVSTITHELGHNLGFQHAGADLDNDGAVDPEMLGIPGFGEYGDFSAAMGNGCDQPEGGNSCEANAPHKVQMGWFPPGKVLDVSQDGVYQIAATEIDPGQTALPQVLRIFGFYYLSTRKATGFDANIDENAFGFRFAGRTSVHRHSDWEGNLPPARASGPAATHTLFVDSLADGEVFSDPRNGFTVTQMSHSADSVTVALDFEPQSQGFYTVTPCRVFDTRTPPTVVLFSGEDYMFSVGGLCGVPTTAKAVSLNVAVTSPSAAGHLTMYPANVDAPLTSILNFKPGQTLANNVVLGLSRDGLGIVHVVPLVQGNGWAHVIVDINGYFE